MTEENKQASKLAEDRQVLPCGLTADMRQDQSFIYSSTDALVSCLKNNIKIYIKINISVNFNIVFKTTH